MLVMSNLKNLNDPANYSSTKGYIRQQKKHLNKYLFNNSDNVRTSPRTSVHGLPSQ